uniref:Uncharacterized protein n=1 Tax=Rhizophora mucronata TaxID=61149 RepID=A0A2P2PDV7_RHIMU
MKHKLNLVWYHHRNMLRNHQTKSLALTTIPTPMARTHRTLA